MSSMLRHLRKSRTLLATIAATGLTAFPAPALAEMQSDTRGSSMLARQPSSIAGALAQWERLQADRELRFADYAGFVLKYPDFPRTELLQIRAENTLEDETPGQADVLRFFDARPPLTNRGRALYALSLAGAQRDGAAAMAREAWRGGTMSGPAEVYLLSLFGSQFTAEDHAARMNALLWQQNAEAAERHMINLSAKDRQLAMARLVLLRGTKPAEAGLTIPPEAMRDAGYIFNLVNHYRAKRETGNAIRLLATRPSVNAPAFDAEEMLGDILAVAKAASAADTVRIVSRVDDLFEPSQDISKGSFRLRDRYTDLMWMGGTNALWRQYDGTRAASMFERYGKAAQSPLTRSKGFYWAGRASRQAGNEDQARRYFEMAAEFPHYYYGQLALNAMGKPMPEFAQLPRLEISAADRAEFEARPIVQAIRQMAQNRRDWRTERRFFEEIGEQAKTPQELMLTYELAKTNGLDEMAVVVGMEASANGFTGFERIGFPTVDVPRINDWTMVHAIARQESEFDRTRRSHANAIGMMQLLRSTAREEAGILGIQYLSANLTEDPKYNITLGDAHFARRMDLYGGAYPLAIASYNAGPGRVREWVRLNGDPRMGDIDWVTWIEKIPANFETRYYVMRVIGNAVTYSHMYPDQAGLPRTVDRFLP